MSSSILVEQMNIDLDKIKSSDYNNIVQKGHITDHDDIVFIADKVYFFIVNNCMKNYNISLTERNKALYLWIYKFIVFVYYRNGYDRTNINYSLYLLYHYNNHICDLTYNDISVYFIIFSCITIKLYNDFPLDNKHFSIMTVIHIKLFNKLEREYLKRINYEINSIIEDVHKKIGLIITDIWNEM